MMVSLGAACVHRVWGEIPGPSVIEKERGTPLHCKLGAVLSRENGGTAFFVAEIT